MRLHSRPWDLDGQAAETARLGPADCFLGEGDRPARIRGADYSVLMARGDRELRLYPYPPRGAGTWPCRIVNLPARPRIGTEPESEEERRAVDALVRMHRVLARVDELEAALDDPANLWDRLRAAWTQAEQSRDPRMAEIVRQARELKPILSELEASLRRVLRRSREAVPLDRVQEMDRASMLWLVRQPGRSIAERAGSDQRVLAIVRQENFDTLENRVLHAYVRLAARHAAQWLREHSHAPENRRYRMVEAYRRQCRRLARRLAELGVGVARPDVPPNYVLLEVRAYRMVRTAWIRLLRHERAQDELWAWQAETWTDFCTLAITVSLAAIEGARLIAQSPIVWLDEAEQGRRFRADRPLAVFWLEAAGLVVEVQPRPRGVTALQFAARAPLWLRISSMGGNAIEQRVPIWTPHCFEPLDLERDTDEAARMIARLRQHSTIERIERGLILAPMHDEFVHLSATAGGCRVEGVTLGAEGDGLRKGMNAVAAFVNASVLGLEDA